MGFLKVPSVFFKRLPVRCRYQLERDIANVFSFFIAPYAQVFLQFSNIAFLRKSSYTIDLCMFSCMALTTMVVENSLVFHFE